MTPKLYIFKGSPPVGATLMLLKHLGLDVEIEVLDMIKQQHFIPEYLKLNPTHTVPTLVEDDGFILWESHAILPYLVQKYGKDDSLYPKDLRQRAIVDQRMNFDNGTAFVRLSGMAKPIFLKQKDKINENDYINVNEVYGFMENFLSNTEWVAGNHPTIADYSLFATISSLNVIIPIDTQKYAKLLNWLVKCETLPGYEAGVKNLKAFRIGVKLHLGINKM